jgi:hypothetical protein
VLLLRHRTKAGKIKDDLFSVEDIPMSNFFNIICMYGWMSFTYAKVENTVDQHK